MKTIVQLDKSIKSLFMSSFSSLLLLLFLSLLPLLCYSDDWLTEGHDVVHSGKSSDIVKPPLKLKSRLLESYKGNGIRLGLPVSSGGQLNVHWLLGDHIAYALNSLKKLWQFGYVGLFQACDYYPAIGGENKDYVFQGGGHGGIFQCDVRNGATTRMWSDMNAGAGGGIYYNGYFYAFYSSETVGGFVIKSVYPYPLYGDTKWKRCNSFEYDTTYPLEKTTQGDLSTPCMAENTLYISWNGHIHAMNPETGLSKWSVGKPLQYISSVAYENGKIYTGGTEGIGSYTLNPAVNCKGMMYCLDAKTGDAVWTYKFSDSILMGTANGYTNYPTTPPIVSDGIVYFGGLDGNFYALNSTTGALIWKFAADFPFSYRQGAAISDDVIYFGCRLGYNLVIPSSAGVLYCCNRYTGELLWRWENPDKVGFGPVIIADKKLITTGEYGYVYVFEADTVNTELIQKPKNTFPSIVKSGNSFVIECKGVPSDSGWSASLKKYNTTVNLSITAGYNVTKAIWELTAVVPSDTQEDMYDLYVSNNSGNETKVNSVKVLKDIKTSYYYIHITAPTYSTSNYDLTVMLNQLKLINPEFVIISGNLVGSGSDNNFQALTAALQSYDIPVYPVPGESDCNGGVDSETHKSYERNIGSRYFSFNYGNHKYLGIDTTDDNGKIGTAQMSYVRQELQGSYDMKTVFYYKDNANQLPSICDEFGVSAALSYGSNNSTKAGVIPTNYLKTNSCVSGASGYYRVVKVMDNKVNTYNALALYSSGTLQPPIQYSLTPYSDSTNANDGRSKVNLLKIENHTTELFDNCRFEYLMPSSNTYIFYNGELASSIDQGSGRSVVKTKYIMTGGTDYTHPYVKYGYIGLPETALVKYYSDKDLTQEVAYYMTSSTPFPKYNYAKDNRMYFKIFNADGVCPSFSIDQPGELDFTGGQTEKLDSTGLLYKGYYDVVKDNGKEYKDGETSIKIISSGKIIEPDIGNIFRIKTITPTPYFKYCTAVSDGINISGEAITKELIDYNWNYPKGVYAFRKALPSGDWQLVYSFTTATSNYFTWKDTTAAAGITYRYKLCQRNALGTDSLYTDEYEVTRGGPIISAVTTSSITSNSAVIKWTTDVLSDSQVEYAGYAGAGYTAFTYTDVSRLESVNASPLDSTSVTSHSVTLTGLTFRIYGYRVISRTVDGKVNSSGGIRYPTLTFTTTGNSGSIVSLEGVAANPYVFPGDRSSVTVYGKDASGKRADFVWGSIVNYTVTAGGGSLSALSSINTAHSTALTTGSGAGNNRVMAVKTGATPLTVYVDVSGVYPDHYKVECPASIVAGEIFNATITSYSNAGETVVLPITTTDKNFTIKAVKGDDPNTVLTGIYSALGSLTSGVKIIEEAYNKVETTGIKIKVEDAGGKTGISNLISVLGNANKKWKITGELNKQAATIGENITITGKVLDIYGNAVITSGTLVTFSLIQGNGVLSSNTATTDGNGEAKTTITVPDNIISIVELSTGTLEKSRVYIKANAIASINLAPEVTTVKSGAKTDVNIYVKDAGDQGVAGVNLNITIISGAGSLSANSIITDETGKATFMYIGNTVLGVSTIKAETADTTVSTTANITTVTGDLDHYDVLTPLTANVGSNFTVIITAKDKYENLILSNESVNLETVKPDNPSSFGLGTLSVLAVTLSSGSATITNETYSKAESIKVKVKNSNNIEGYSGTISVKSSIPSVYDTDLVYPYDTTTYGDNIIFFHCPSKVKTGTPVQMVTYVKDNAGNAVGSTTVTYTKDKGTLANVTQTSDSNGIVKNTFTAVAGVCIVTLSSGTSSTNVTIEGLTPNIMSVPSNPAMFNQNQYINCAVFITLKDSLNNAIPYGVIGYSIVSGTGTIKSCNPLREGTQYAGKTSYITNSEGVLKLMISGLTAGADSVLRLTCSGISSYDVTLRKIGNYFYVCKNSIGLAGTNFQISPQLFDNTWTGVSNATINFSVTGDSVLNINSVLTDANGYAGNSLLLSSQFIPNVVTMNYLGMTAQGNIQIIQGDIGLTANNSVISAGTCITITANIMSSSGKSIDYNSATSDGNCTDNTGTILDLSILSGIGGSLGASQVVTDASGKASVAFTAGSSTGNVTIRAVSGSKSATVNLKVVNVIGLDVNVSVPNLLINSGNSDISVTAKDSLGYTVRGASVGFSLITGTGSLTSSNGVTDDSGIVKTTLTGVNAAGDNTIRISCGGITKDVVIKSINSLIGCKIKISAPAVMAYTTLTIIGSNKDIFVQVVNNIGESVGVNGITVVFNATGGNFKYAGNSWLPIASITNVTNAYGKIPSLENTAAAQYNTNYYPSIGQNAITITAAGFTSDIANILGVSGNPYVFYLRSEPVSVKPAANTKIIAKISSGGNPLAGESVKFVMVSSTGSLSSGTAAVITDNNGESSCMLSATNDPNDEYLIRISCDTLGLLDILKVSTAKTTIESYGIEPSITNGLINQPFNLKIKALDLNGGSAVLTGTVAVTISAVLTSNVTILGAGTLNMTTLTIVNNIDSSVSLTNLTYTAAESIKIKVEGGGKTSLSDAIIFTKEASSMDVVISPANCIAPQTVMVSGRIKDIDEKGVINKTISFTSTVGTLSTNAVISDPDGKFSAMLTTPASAATITVTATCSTIVGTANVTATGAVNSYIVSVPTAGDRNGFAITVTAKDLGGNTVKCGSMINLTVVTGTGTLGVTTVRLTDGVATITETYSKVENGVKIKATDGNNKQGTSGTVNLSDSMPRVITVAPNTVSNSASVTLTITGLNYYGGGSSSVVSSVKIKESAETVLSGWSCVSDSVINSAVVLSKVKSGTYDVIITTTLGGSNSVSDMKLLVTTTAPTITTLSGSSAEYGKAVTIAVTGAGFFGGTDSNNLTGIRITSSPVTNITTGYTVVSDSSITNVIIPSSINVGSYSLIVKTGGGDSGGKAVTITAALPTVTNVIPSSGYKHITNTIRLVGSGFFGGVGSNNVTQIKLSGTSIVTINPGYSVVSDTAINNVVVNGGITKGTYDVLVTTVGGTNSTSTVRYEGTELAPSPVIDTVTPATVEYNNAVTLAIAGNGFYGATGSNKVTGIRITTSPVANIVGYSVVSDSSIINIPVTAGMAIGSYNIIVTTIGGDSLGKAFTVTSPIPTVTTVTPSNGYNYVNNTISITGTGFFGGLGSNNVSQIKLSGTSIVTINPGYSVVSDTVINNVVVNSGISAGSYDVQVTNGGGTSTSTLKYTVIADTTVPTVVTAVANATLINITFSEDVSAATATNKGNYSLESPTGTGARNLSSATISYTNKVVTIGSLSLTSGNTFTVTVTNVQDAAGNTIVNNGSTNKASGTVAAGDITPPTGSININNSAVYISTNLVTLILSASDASGVTQMRFSDDGSSFGSAEAYTGTRAYTLLAGDGVKTVYVQYKDTPGNWSSAVISDTITLDTTGPVGTVNINSSAEYTQTTTVTLQLTYSDVLSGVSKMQFSNDGAGWSAEENTAANKVWSLDSMEGVKTVYVRYKDVVGNLSSITINHTITLDATAPEGSLIINGGVAYTNSQAGYLTLTASDASGIAEMRFSSNGTDWTTAEAYSTSKSYNLPVGDGTKKVYVQYKDNTGNWSSTEMSSTIILDTTAPAGTIAINNSAAYTKSTTVTLSMNATDDLSGILKMDFSNNGSTWNGEEDYAVNKVWSLDSADGNKTVYAKYKDNAGNTATVTSTIKLVSAKYLKVEGPVNVIAGTSLNITIKAMKQDDTTATGYLDLIGLSSTDTSSTFVSNYTFTSSDSGVNVMNVVFKSAGAQTIEVNDNEVTGITKGSIEVKVYAGAVINYISGGNIETADGTCVSIPQGAMESNVTLGFGVTESLSDVKLGYKFRNTTVPIGRDFGELDMLSDPWRFKSVKFKQPVTIWIPYKKSEIGNIEEKNLRIFGYNEVTGKYELVEGAQAVENGRVKVKVKHFSSYRVLGTYISTDLSNVIAYPNPYRPNAGADGKMKIINLPIDCTATIYNIAGEKIRELRELDLGNLGWIEWDGKNDANELVARGVYLYVIMAPDGSKKVGKCALIK